jgi:hypothetical protein
MANQIFDLTSANAVLKELYDGQIPENMVYMDHPFLAMVEKKTDFGGRNYPIPVQYGVSQGRSSQFPTAQGNQSANQFVEFLLTRVSDYSLATISNELLLAATTDRESFIRSATNLVDGAITSCVASLSSALFRSGTGSIGQINSSGPSAGVITLADVSQVTQFEKNMVLQANATDGGATPRAALGYVIARNAALGTITVSATFGGAAGNPAAWAANDFLLVQGDNNNKISGLGAWLPVTAPAPASSFFGVDRSPDTRLYGMYNDYSNESIEEAWIDGSQLLSREGGTPDVGICSFASYGALEKSLGAKVQYIDMKGPGEIAFRGIMVNGAKKQIKIFPDKDAQGLSGWLLTMKTWKLCSLLDAPMILKYGSNDEMLRVYNADQAELRVGYYANLGCSAPGWNMQIKLSA